MWKFQCKVLFQHFSEVCLIYEIKRTNTCDTDRKKPSQTCEVACSLRTAQESGLLLAHSGLQPHILLF